MLCASSRHLFAVGLSGAWLFLFTVSAMGEETATPQSSSAAAQANSAALQSFTELLKAEAARSEEATKHERDVIRHALTVFTWIVGVVGALLVTGAALLGWAMAAWNRASKTDIQHEVRTQLQAGVTEAIEMELKTTRTLVARLGDEAEDVSKQLQGAKSRVSVAEERLNEQKNTITKLVALTLGPYPYDYLKAIYNKKNGLDPDRTFVLQPGAAFKREMNFLIDSGYLANIDLSGFSDNVDILDALTITETGELYVKFREGLAVRPL
jgi:hypothetical protein